MKKWTNWACLVNPKFVILFVFHKLIMASSKVHTLCLKLVFCKLVMEQQASHIPHLYSRKQSRNNQKLVTQHSSSVDGVTFPPLVSYMY